MEWQQHVSSFLAFSLTLQVQIAKPNFSFFFFFVFLIQPACLLSFAIDNNTFQPKLVDISLSLSQMWKCSVQRVECVLLLLPSSIDFKITYLNEICAGMQLIYLTIITHLWRPSIPLLPLVQFRITGSGDAWASPSSQTSRNVGVHPGCHSYRRLISDV